MTDLVALKAANSKHWAAAKLLKPGTFTAVAKHLADPAAKQRYQAVSVKTGVPWYAIAVIHERECSQDWTGSLAQGDPWNKVSVHVPAGRGPFNSWEDAAIDALVNCAPYAARNKDWSIGGALTMLEQYNGLKYYLAGRPSPYIWAGTDQYTTGKVLVDHGPIEDIYPSGPNKGKPVIDNQLGCAGLLMAMMQLDPTITFTGAVLTPIPVVPKPVALAVPKPSSVSNPSPGSIGAFIASIFATFKRG